MYQITDFEGLRHCRLFRECERRYERGDDVKTLTRYALQLGLPHLTAMLLAKCVTGCSILVLKDAIADITEERKFQEFQEMDPLAAEFLERVRACSTEIPETGAEPCNQAEHQ